jgi:Tfp pilus assembly protein PilF
VLAAAALLVLATVAAYHNSLGGPFILDDEKSITANPSICHLGSVGSVLSPPSGGGITVSGRPVLNLSLAVNYALSQTNVRGYHMVNMAIHALAVLVLFGVVRRTLLLGDMSERFGQASPYLALAVAMLWAVHPLQTESVTYVVQRAESLMGLFYLLTLYCVIRSSDSHAAAWSVAAVAACAMGMATKEVMVTAPLIVLLYDRTFLAGSFGQALRKRWGLYAGLAACWALQAYLVASVGNRGGTAGFGAEDVPNWRSYGLTQFGAVLHYLRLTFWPDALCLDYDRWVATTPWEILPGAILVSALAAATIRGLCRGRKWGFLGAWFLVILAPTSSILPIRDTLFEHRMYLPLAAVVSAAVLGVFLLWRKLLPKIGGFGGGSAAGQWTAPWLALAIIAGALGFRTVLRNMDYRSCVALWQNAVDHYPSNSRAHGSLGFALNAHGDYDPAIGQFRQAIRFNPKFVEAYYNLGFVLSDRGELEEAIQALQYAIRLKPNHPEAYNNLGVVLYSHGKVDPAIEQFRQAIRLNPQADDAHNNLGVALQSQGKLEDAIKEFRQAIHFNAQNADAHTNLGVVLESQGQLEDAIEQFRQAIYANPQFLKGYKNLATVLSRVGRNEEAAEARNHAAALESASGQL